MLITLIMLSSVHSVAQSIIHKAEKQGPEDKMKIMQCLLRGTFFVAICLTLIGIPLDTAESLPSATIVNVDTILDEYEDPGPGAGCSLREAITAANWDTGFGGCQAGSGTDTVLLPAGTYTLTIPGNDEDYNVSGDLDIFDDLQLEGSGTVIITAGGDTGIIEDRVFDIFYSTTVTMTNLTVTGGRIPNDIGGEHYGGGILNSGTLTLDHVIVTNNRAGDGYDGGAGGGIFSYTGSSLTLTDSLISNNHAGNGLNGDASGANGGDGGGIYASTAYLSITNSSITGNHAGDAEPAKLGCNGGWGGGIVVSSSSDTTILGSTISGNTAGSSDSGAGGSGGGIVARSELLLVNSTISGNTSGSTTSPTHGPGHGGGIISPFSTTSIIIRYSTIYNNHTGSGASNAYGGGIYSSGSFILGASILAGNSDKSGDGPDCSISSGTVNSEDFNLIGNPTGCTFSGYVDNNIVSPVGFNLPLLANNGGPTQTHHLPFGSQLIDKIPQTVEFCNVDLDPFYDLDQRGFLRPVDGDKDGSAACDIGAYEALPPGAFMPLIKK
jgi:CSLREA domain-containing protein